MRLTAARLTGALAALTLPLLACAGDVATTTSGAVTQLDPTVVDPIGTDPAATDPNESSSEPNRDPAQPTAWSGSDFVVHEWGTYTSLQTSDGVTLPGLHHEEEPLPSFVSHRCLGCEPKSVEVLPEEVTQKLETPVIYFYSDKRVDVRVDVDFPRGVISEYYPAPTTFSPPIGELAALADTAMSWSVTVDPEIAPKAFPPVGEDDIWAPSRRTAATPIVRGEEHERFIFYRGLGRFEMPFVVTSGEPTAAAAQGTLTLANGGDVAVPWALVMDRDAEGGGLTLVTAGIAAGAKATVPVPERTLDGASFRAAARDALVDALVGSGLYEDESVAMVDTWEKSWLDSTGLRVLYVAPRSWTDALLPITVTPAPDQLERTLVGRVEVMTRADELALLAEVDALEPAGADLTPCLDALYAHHGRLMEARLRAARRRNAETQRQDREPLLDALIQQASGPYFGLSVPGAP